MSNIGATVAGGLEAFFRGKYADAPGWLVAQFAADAENDALEPIAAASRDLIGVDVTLDGFAARTLPSKDGPNFIDVVRLDKGYRLTWSVDAVRRVIAAGGAFKA